MKKKLLSVILLITSLSTIAQIGINTVNPSATLDVVGKPTVPTSLDGIIAPRLTGDQLHTKNYTNAQTGALVYVTVKSSLLSGQTSLVTTKGYYQFDGIQWQPFITGEGSKWSYDAASQYLKLNNLSNGVTARPSGTEFVIQDDGKVGIGTNNPLQPLHLSSTGGIFVDRYESTYGAFTIMRSANGSISNPTAILNNQPIGYIQARAYNGSEFYNKGALIQFVAVGDQSSTNSGAKIVFQTVGAASLEQTVKMTIADNGNVGIMETNPDSMLHIKSANGSTPDITLEAIAVNNSNSGKINFLERDDTGFVLNYNGLYDNFQFSSKRTGTDTLLMTISRNSANNAEGNVGIGIDIGVPPVAKLEVNGEIKVGNNGTSNPCSSGKGTIYFDKNNGKFYGCTGSTSADAVVLNQ